MKYRPEIDGLRAISVIPVIFFHAGFSSFEGGFVGVDVFFVISGFLITKLITTDIDANRFTFGDFYERRARRILPAIIFVTSTCLPLAWFLMLPGQLQVFFGSVFANSIFLSNFFFLTQIEYFQPDAHLQPLMHTWSLSIEEQYYLLFPALISVIWKRSKWSSLVLISALTSVGIYFAYNGITGDPAKNYFHSLSRFWEIGMGSCAALFSTLKDPRPNKVFTTMGLVCIFFSIFYFDKLTPYPSLYTLIPCIGATLVLLFGSASSGPGRVLSLPPLVGMGLISYSAYLWHQPLFAFARLSSLNDLGPITSMVLSLLSIVLAYFTWRYVENPFRRKPKRLIQKRSKLIFCALGISSIFAVSGLFGYFLEGFPERIQNGTALGTLETRLSPNYGLSSECAAIDVKSDACQTSSSFEVVVWGDSYAMHLVNGILAQYPDAKLIQRTLPGCAPLKNLAFLTSQLPLEYAQTCNDFNSLVIQELEDAQRSLKVIISSEFALDEKVLWNTYGRRIPPEKRIEALKVEIRTIIGQLTALGHTVSLVSPPPEAGYDLGQCLSKAKRYRQPLAACDFRRDKITNTSIFDVLDGLEKDVNIIRLDDEFCEQDVCKVSYDDVFLYRDKGHLSLEGSTYLGKVLLGFAKAELD